MLVAILIVQVVVNMPDLLQTESLRQGDRNLVLFIGLAQQTVQEVCNLLGYDRSAVPSFARQVGPLQCSGIKVVCGHKVQYEILPGSGARRGILFHIVELGDEICRFVFRFVAGDSQGLLRQLPVKEVVMRVIL